MEGKSNVALHVWAAILAMLLCGILALLGLRGTGGAWEYKAIAPSDLSLIEEMNAAGAEGWEMVFARRARDSGDNMVYEMLMKRPK